jgi:hypothetical protein
MHRFIVMAAFVLALALPSVASAATQTLTVEKKGAGSGTVTSSPAGIDCGATCSAPFTEGSTVVLKAVSGANTATVLWTGCSAGETLENECKVAMSAAKSVTATFNLLERKLTVEKKGTGAGTVTSSPSGINCGATCSAGFVKGTTVTLTGVPGSKTLAPSWSGCDSVDAEGKCLVTMSKAREVTATFNLAKWSLTVTKVGSGTGMVTGTPAGIECGATCSAGFIDGTEVTLTGTSGLHTKPVKWSGCTEVLTGDKCLVTISAAKTVIASFELEKQWTEYTVTVQKKGTGNGIVTSVPGGIECGEDCSEAYLYHTQLTLTATPAEGSVFVEWQGGGCLGQTGPCATTVNRSMFVKAVFAAIGPRRLTVSKAGAGTGTVTSKPAGIDCGSACSAQFEAPTKVALHATAAQGSSFSGWSGAGCSGAAACKVTMSEARNVTATFAKLPGPAPRPSTLFVGGSAKVKGGKALLRLTCSGGTPCKGTLKLVATIHNALGQAKRLVIAKATYSLAAGASSVLEAKLSSRAMSLLRSQGRLRVRATGGGFEGRGLKLAR